MWEGMVSLYHFIPVTRKADCAEAPLRAQCTPSGKLESTDVSITNAYPYGTDPQGMAGEEQSDGAARHGGAGQARPAQLPSPLGYRLVGQGSNQRVEVDEEEAAYVREAFRLAADGWSLRQILARLTALGLRTARGKEMSPIALAKILRNRFYLGEIFYRGSWLPAEHQPIT